MGSSKPEARTTGEDPVKQKEPKQYKEKDFQGMDPDHMKQEKVLRELFRLNQKQKQQINRMEKRINDLEKTQQVNGSQTLKNTELKILERYNKRKRERFLSTVFNAGTEGLQKQEVGEIFEVKCDRATDIMKEMARQYEFLEWEYPGGPVPGTLYHKLSREADKIAQFMIKHGVDNPNNSEEVGPEWRIMDVLEIRFDWEGDKTDISNLENLREFRKGLESGDTESLSSREIKKKLGFAF